MSELNMSDIMLTSTQVQHCLSESNLQKLAQEIPEIYFNENVFDDKQKLTMSILKREMSGAVNEEFPFYENPRYHGVSSITTDDESSDFDPASLSSLPDDKSDDSDALFQSAEMDFSDNKTPVKSPVLGKSSSFPIAIKLSSRSTQDELDLISDSDNPKSIFSSHVCSDKDSLSNLKNVSNNSLSLAEALRTTQATTSLCQFAHLFHDAHKEILLLKSHLHNAQTDFQSAYHSTYEELANVKDILLTICRSKVAPVNCKNCLYLKKEVENLINKNNQLMEKIDQLGKINPGIPDELLKSKTSLVEANDLVNKLEVQLESSRVQITDLETHLANLNGNLDQMKSQQQKYYDEKLQLISELDKYKLEASSKFCEYERQNVVSEKKISELSSKLQTQESAFFQKEAALQCEFDNKNKDLEKMNELIISFREMLQRNEEKYEASINHYISQVNNITTEHTKALSEIADLTNHLEACKCNLSEVQSTLATTQQVNDANLEHISVLNGQIKELKKLLNEKHREISQVKDHLNYQKQLNFNQVINKIKKEKDSQIHDAQAKCSHFEKEIMSLKLKIENLNQEITTHKNGFSVYEDDMTKMKQSLMGNVDELKNKINELKDVNSSLKQENEQLSSDNKRITVEIIKMSEENTRLTESLEEIKQEKLRVLQELKTQYNEALEKEKASILLNCELEKESIIEKCGRSEHVIRASSSLE